MRKRGSPMREIFLHGGPPAFVDDADFDWAGETAWYWLNGYAVCVIGVRRVGMHRLVMGAQPGLIVDHINRNKLDNRRSNLRFCTVSQNAANKKPSSKQYPYKGINGGKHRRQMRYRAVCTCNGIEYRGKYHKTIIEAARDYDVMAVEKFGEFALVNFPAAPDASSGGRDA